MAIESKIGIDKIAPSIGIFKKPTAPNTIITEPIAEIIGTITPRIERVENARKINANNNAKPITRGDSASKKSAFLQFR